MCVITTSFPDLSVQDRDTVPGLGPVRGALLSAGQHPVRPPELALRFILSNPDVATVIPGMRKPGNVRSNAWFGCGQPSPMLASATDGL